VDWLGRTLAEESMSLGPADYPHSQWQPGDTVRRLIGIKLPYDVNGRYRSQIQVTDENGTPLSRTWKTIGPIQIEPWPMVRELPDTAYPSPAKVTWADTISLAGYNITHREDVITITLYWQSDSETGADYGVFVHVGQPGQPPVAQSSGGPANWTRPTTSWRQGEIIEDIHTITLPPNLITEDSSIFVGLYEIDNPDSRVPITESNEPVSDNVWPLTAKIWSPASGGD
jgi:hypothetical protein